MLKPIIWGIIFGNRKRNGNNDEPACKERAARSRDDKPCSVKLEALEERRLLSVAHPAGLSDKQVIDSPANPSLTASGTSDPTASSDATAAKANIKSKPKKPRKIVYSGPITITHGGVYSGNWQSQDPNVPAVRIRTSDPVTIQNSNIISRGTLIDAFGFAANLTVRNTRGVALNPNVRGRYPGRFMDIDGFTNIVAENNYMQGTSGIYLYNYLGNHTPSQSIKVLRNQALNIDGRYSDGKGGFLTGPNDNYFVQFFQSNGLHNMAGVEVAWNQVINQPGQSRVEENINIFDTTGTPSSPIRIHDNYIRGAYAADPAHDASYTGGGIMISDVGSSYVQAYNNQIVDTGNEGITITSGHDNSFYNNRILSSGLLPDGERNPSQNVGAIIWNYNHEQTFRNNSGYNNLIGWMLNGQQNNEFVPDAARWSNNQSYPGVVTPQVEAGEWTLWQSKLAKARIKVGPTT